MSGREHPAARPSRTGELAAAATGGVASTPRGFLRAAASAGMISGSVGVALPLLAIARGFSPAAAADLVALFMLAFAVGAAAAGPLVPIAGARNLVATGIAVSACGLAAALAAGSGLAWLALSALLDGAGLGCFWVGSQLTMGRGAGIEGAERRFVRHYVAYVIGSAIGAAAVGLVAQLLRASGLSATASLRLAFGLPLMAAVLGLASWPPARIEEIDRRRRASPPRARRARSSLAMRGLALQLPDVLLVAALSVLAPLAPVILVHSFRFSAAAVGTVSGALAGAKILGSLTAERTTRRLGRRRLVTTMLMSGAACTLVLASVRAPAPFLVLLFVAVLAIAGAWPVVVEAALARIEPGERRAMVVAWNMREYTTIAMATAGGGWLLGNLTGVTWLFVVAAGLLAASAVISHAVLRRPVRAVRIAVAADASRSAS